MTIQIISHWSLYLQANLVEHNAASQILNIYAHGAVNPKISIMSNIFHGNTVPPSTLGSNVIHVIGGNTEEAWHIHGNKLSNPFCLFEMSSVVDSVSDPTVVAINATNNYFNIIGESNLCSSLMDSHLYDDDEGLNPKFIFEPYLTGGITLFCPLNCTDH